MQEFALPGNNARSMVSADSEAQERGPARAARLAWSGEVVAVQPRIRLLRSFDQRNHAYPGYALFLRGTLNGIVREFSVGLGPGAQAKHAFRAGDSARGHRRLDARTYEASCRACIWGCRMPVEITLDQWNPDQREYRFETFCYGPKSCPAYRAGPTRKVPGRKGMKWEEEDWVDEEAIAHRGPDE
jgi:hypothetical protein